MTSTARSSLIGAGIGATVMFLADPARGARRRALVRDKLVWATRKTRDGAGATWRDLGNRMTGAQARLRGAASSVSDPVLMDRIRTALGRVTAHPRAISVMVDDGSVVLRGEALDSEIPAIVSIVNTVRGVKSVINEIRSHVTAEHMPALQGGSHRPGRRRSWRRSAWSPTAKLAVCAGLGMCALAAALGRRRSY